MPCKQAFAYIYLWIVQMCSVLVGVTMTLSNGLFIDAMFVFPLFRAAGLDLAVVAVALLVPGDLPWSDISLS
jgi:hypothetical protein